MNSLPCFLEAKLLSQFSIRTMPIGGHLPGKRASPGVSPAALMLPCLASGTGSLLRCLIEAVVPFSHADMQAQAQAQAMAA
jgi:hypothetical protein